MAYRRRNMTRRRRAPVRRRRVIRRKAPVRRRRVVKRVVGGKRRVLTVGPPDTIPYKRGRFNAGLGNGESRREWNDVRSDLFGAAVNRVRGTTVVRGVQELGRFKAQAGTGKPTQTSTLLRMSVPYRILRWQRMNQDYEASAFVGFNGILTGGGIKIENNIGSVDTLGGFMPMYVFALNDTVQGGVSGPCMYQPTMHSTGRVSWNPITGFNYLSEAATGWQVEVDETGSEAARHCRWIANNWHQVKLKMFGAKTQQTTFFVEYVQCNKDYAAIEDEPVLLNSTSVLAEKYRDEVYSFWQNKVKSLVSNTIAGPYVPHRDPGNSNTYSTIMRWRFEIKPVETDEADTRPNAIQASLFLKDGRLVDYQWRNAPSAYDAANNNLAQGLDDFIVRPHAFLPDNYSQNPGIEQTCAPRGRRYLIIRATCPKENGDVDGEQSADITPSFDLMVRKREQLGRTVLG